MEGGTLTTPLVFLGVYLLVSYLVLGPVHGFFLSLFFTSVGMTLGIVSRRVQRPLGIMQVTLLLGSVIGILEKISYSRVVFEELNTVIGFVVLCLGVYSFALFRRLRMAVFVSFFASWFFVFELFRVLLSSKLSTTKALLIAVPVAVGLACREFLQMLREMRRGEEDENV